MSIIIPSLKARLAYRKVSGCATREGHLVEDSDRFREFLAGPVKNRASDREYVDSWENEILQLASTDANPQFLAQFFDATVDDLGWELGEAFAETIFTEDTEREILWPWNATRDRKTPRASLPGADLVGFVKDDAGYTLLLGEVKTSADIKSPPGVMYGKKGMNWQLHQNATALTIHNTLWKWLRCRCQHGELKAAYRNAVQRYIKSSGKDITIAGVLCRDTKPNEKDLLHRGTRLGTSLSSPTRVELCAWYLPIPIEQWVSVAGGES